ncbi:hypothetical protein EYF80_021027 [Liparis tanakae]|uniref:Uncharacterized protein n=1 Tax=Liparis tanakae TaxID=230148 RepID=A0A4Z2HTR9_9TELE|nr:hypothetical protein EYF80_021027 [Liparis tanakae]
MEVGKLGEGGQGDREEIKNVRRKKSTKREEEKARGRQRVTLTTALIHINGGRKVGAKYRHDKQTPQVATLGCGCKRGGPLAMEMTEEMPTSL